MKRSLILAALVAAAPWLGAATPKYGSALIRNVPPVRQKPDFCGEACVEMYLRKLGHAVDQDRVFNVSGTDPELGRGCTTKELATALRRFGFDVGPVWARIAADKAAAGLEAQWRALHVDLLAGIPSIVCTRYNDTPDASEHFRLILGYDADKDEVVYHEPAKANGAYRRMGRPTFLKLWPLKYQRREWTVIRLRLEPNKISLGKRPPGLQPADFAQHIMRLRKRLDKKTFTIVVRRPFVVIGDESAAVVKRRAEGTVKWSVDSLKESYFAKDPDHIIDIWLFKDKKSYQSNTRKFLGEVPSTPFGYYSSSNRALVMNIATGGGTLVHEIVHPFIAANFPDCPSWFNEGLASLYEQCGSSNGRITGYTNWRLAGLQKVIRAGTLPSFKELTASDSEFYGMDRGDNYAQARYLCYYLQERGLLRRFYREFRQHCKKDPGGFKTLARVLGEKDMTAFEKKWKAYVLKLRFR